jgi:hypothetical protein
MDKDATAQLASSIVTSSILCAQPFNDIIEDKEIENGSNNWARMVFEFAYFFIHMIQRETLKKYGSETRDKLFDGIFLIIASTTIDTIFGEMFNELLPKEMKDGIILEFTPRYNQAEDEYSKCKKIMSVERPFTDAALLTVLSQRVAQVYGSTFNPEIYRICHTQATENFKQDEYGWYDR